MTLFRPDELVVWWVWSRSSSQFPADEAFFRTRLRLCWRNVWCFCGVQFTCWVLESSSAPSGLEPAEETKTHLVGSNRYRQLRHLTETDLTAGVVLGDTTVMSQSAASCWPLTVTTYLYQRAFLSMCLQLHSLFLMLYWNILGVFMVLVINYTFYFSFYSFCL